MNILDDFDYYESTTYDYSQSDEETSVNKWLDDFGWV